MRRKMIRINDDQRTRCRPCSGQRFFSELHISVLLLDMRIRLYYIRIMKPPSFEWDDSKNQENIAKHGVSFMEAQRAFFDERRVIVEDLDHGEKEERWFCFGTLSDGILTVRFTFRGDMIRICGAGYWRKGRKIYEKENNIRG